MGSTADEQGGEGRDHHTAPPAEGLLVVLRVMAERPDSFRDLRGEKGRSGSIWSRFEPSRKELTMGAVEITSLRWTPSLDPAVRVAVSSALAELREASRTRTGGMMRDDPAGDETAGSPEMINREEG